MKERVLIVAPKPSTFVIRDVRLLNDDRPAAFALNPAQKSVRALLTLPFFVLKVIRAGVIITWFADSSKFPVRLARMFGRKSVVIIGGYDVAKIEGIGYGSLLDEKKGEKVRWTLERADAVVAVDQGLVDDLVGHFGKNFQARVIPTGYDASLYQPCGGKRMLVLSVCYAQDRKGLVKGIDVFAECARRMPDVPFRLIGVTGEAMKELGIVPENLEVIGEIPSEEVIHHYQEAKVYCQLSMREGLPNAVCEAMLCECSVVGSDVQGVRTAVDGHGFLVPYGDVARTCEAIRRALTFDGRKGRMYIMDNFSEERRRSSLIALIESICKEDG